MFGSFFSSLGSRLVLTVLTMSTILTTGVAVVKVSESMKPAEVPIKGISIQATEPSPIVSETPTPINSGLNTNIPKPKTTSNSNTSPCVITLFSVEYDVTSINKKGEFSCNKDMSKEYSELYGTDVSRMKAYLKIKPSNSVTPSITANNTNNNPVTPTAIPTAINTNKITLVPTGKTYKYEDDEEDRSDEENKSRYVQVSRKEGEKEDEECEEEDD